MLKIGLTGGIGSGKSVVADIFRVLGIPVFDADSAAKSIMETDPALVAAIIKEFGEQSYQGNKLNRIYIASIVFNDPFKLDRLNAIVHPATISAAEKWMLEQKAPYIIKEAALMFEAGSSTNLSYIIGVRSLLSLRISRVMQRDKVTEEQVFQRMNRQINDDIKMKLCDFIVENNEHELLLPQVLRLHEKFLESGKR